MLQKLTTLASILNKKKTKKQKQKMAAHLQGRTENSKLRKTTRTISSVR